MSYLLPIISFAFVMSITPGPNNIMLWASGANYGFQRTLPHMLGITIGFASLILCCGLGLGALFELFPAFQLFLKIAGSSYLLYLAYRIGTASFENKVGKQTPLSFWEAAGFQYANPKAWVMGLTLMSTFVLPGQSLNLSVITVTLVVMMVNFPCIAVWAAFGTVIGRFLSNKKVLLGFNLIMAALLVATIFLLF